MNANSLHIDLPSDERPSPLPWIVVFVCAAFLIVHLWSLAGSIPVSLQTQASALVDPGQFPDVTINAQGRDLSLEGSIPIGQTTGSLAQKIEQINGVQRVQDNLAIVDPAIEATARLERFTQAITGIDIASVAFQPGSVSFTQESDAALSQLLNVLQQYPEGRLRIEGHTDDTGPDHVNLRVSRDRAAAVANNLIARGIRVEQLVVTGYGSTQPIADNANENGRTRNRRIEISPLM